MNLEMFVKSLSILHEEVVVEIVLEEIFSKPSTHY
jgi:hypothetical protein